MSVPRWPLVIFDLDGTVVNTIPLIIASYQHAAAVVLGDTPSASEARSWIGQPLTTHFESRFPDRADELVAAYLEWNSEHLPSLLQHYPGMAELLAALERAGVRTGVATSKRRESATRTLHHAGLEGKLDLTVTMEDSAKHKPDPEPLLLAVAQREGSAQQAAYVGDAVVDIQAAKAAGMASIAVTWGAGTEAELRAAGPDQLVHTVAELRSVLLG